MGNGVDEERAATGQTASTKRVSGAPLEVGVTAGIDHLMSSSPVRPRLFL